MFVVSEDPHNTFGLFQPESGVMCARNKIATENTACDCNVLTLLHKQLC